LSQPQRVWSLRKGHWDGIKSVGVGENGSVIICTQAGAVWRRIRRAKIKDTYLSITGGSKSKDYKFQRVPGLTKVAAVRSNTFGTYAALRKDCDVTKNQIVVHQQELWEDLAPLFILNDLQGSEPAEDEDDVARFWKPALPKDDFDPLRRAVLVSPDLEADIIRHVRNHSIDHGEYDVEISTSLSEASIPVHGFLLSARSPMLRDALCAYRQGRIPSNTDVMRISGERPIQVVFHGLDFLTVLNMVLYAYTDNVIDVWHFTRHAPKSAFRYRQVRTELMKLASRLGMSKLESAVRLMSIPEPQLSIDLAGAFEDPRFFEDGNAILELDGGSMAVHSALLRQRCPFFEGLFNGRAAGQWLAARREVETEAVKIDMKHIAPSTFELVLRFLYADIGPELFDDIVSEDMDEFCDVVMDVMSVANELMLDRLSQICQQVIGRFVNTRNICHLLNAIAPCAVTEFKNAGLEYLCLQLEAMLENHLLDDLDEDLLLELDEIVRDNQLTCLPFAKSGRAEMLLHERHSSLAGDIDEERQRKVRDLTFRINIRDEDSRLSTSFRTRVGSVDDNASSSPSQDKLRRKSRSARNAPFSPAIRPKDSTGDLMFSMDDEESIVLGDMSSPKHEAVDLSHDSKKMPITPTVSKHMWHDAKTKDMSSVDKSPLASPTTFALSTSSLRESQGNLNQGDASSSTSAPWSSGTLPSSKLGMREIMAQASRGRTSTLSMSLSAEKTKADAAVKAAVPKISQKERRKQQQQALQQAIGSSQSPLGNSSQASRSLTPWQLPSSGQKLSLKDVLDSESKSSPPTPIIKPTISPVPALTNRRTASPDTRFAGQRRTVSSTTLNKSSGPFSSSPIVSRGSPKPQVSKPEPLLPHSKSYSTPASRAEPSLQLSMADIIGQQKREQDLIKEAVAKRSLQEIQEEQAFQEWWDQESRRAQEEEAIRAKGSQADNTANGGSSGKSSRRGRAEARRGRGDAGQGRGQRGRGRGGALVPGHNRDAAVG
jgi:hypothetical protein